MQCEIDLNVRDQTMVAHTVHVGIPISLRTNLQYNQVDSFYSLRR